MSHHRATVDSRPLLVVMETAKAWGATLGVLAGVRLVEVKTAMELILLAVTISFTVWQWIKAAQKHNKP